MFRYSLAVAAVIAVMLPLASAEEVDVIELASKLSTKPAGFEKVVDELSAEKKEVVATKEEKQFIGTWRRGSTEYTFLAGGKGEGKFQDGKTFAITWKYTGIGTYKATPKEEGPHRGPAGTGPIIQWGFGEKPDWSRAYKLGIYQLNGQNGKYTVLFPADGFYDGRDWYSKKP